LTSFDPELASRCMLIESDDAQVLAGKHFAVLGC
jgi:hypothetical protein